MRLNPDEFEVTGETLDDATLAAMFGDEPEPSPKPRRTGTLTLDTYKPKGDIRDGGSTFRATGEVLDGDTIRLAPARSGQPTSVGRLSGFDAYEGGQRGYRTDGSPVPIGRHATETLDGLITDKTNVRGIGQRSYNRPVVIARNGEFDAALPMLWEGNAVADSRFLKEGDPRRGEYFEAERLARLNRQGANQTQRLTPRAYRMADRWNLKIGPGEEAVFTNELPELRPEFHRLDDTERDEFFRFLASQSGNQNFGQANLDAYWKGKGRSASEAADPEFIEAVRKGEKLAGYIDYSAWDAATLADFNKQNAFAGMRPEVQDAYGALLSNPATTAAQLEQFAEINGMTFDPRDVSAFFDAREKGENAAIPLPLIDPGDGRTGAAARGFGDPIGFLDEMGAVVDTLGGTRYRENLGNSDRGFWDVYENNLRQNRAIIDYDETNHPWYRLGGQLVSGAAIPGSIGVRGVSGYAKAGAAFGGAYGFGSADGNIGDRFLNVPVNAALGATLGATAGKAFDVAAPVIGKGFDKLRGIARETPDGHELHPDFEVVGHMGEEDIVRAVDETAPSHADMAAEPNPSISGPRIRDTIDVRVPRPRPVGEGPSEDLMRAATARVEPQDVLPRSRDELTAEEAAALGQGPFREVDAPRERELLEPRQYPSQSNPDVTINRRGPADLVTFARTLNGIRDEGGELTATGISNAARKGDDFAGAENRLGKLVNAEGMSIEEAAQRAYDEGYFPELDRPPTRQEFIAALDDTYRGVGRRFRPDDEAEIQNFEGARDQRLAVERSRQEGAPLAEDVGQPTTLDDVIANTPPALDPDDWNAATLKQVGNIRVDKLDTPQEISRALKVADDITGGFSASRRGVITQAETEALASDLGMTAEKLLARRNGQAFNAEEALAARRILAASSNELVNMARRIRQAGDDPGSEVLAQFRKALVRHTAIQEQVSGATAEAGRALAQFRMGADSREFPGRVLEGLVNAGGGAGRLKDAAEAIITLERDPASLNQFVEKAAKAKTSDKLVELWYNFLLSGPTTHAVNVLSNTLTSIAQIPEHAVAAGIGKARDALTPERRKLLQDRVTLSEVGARAAGLLQGAREGMREAAYAFRTGESRDFVTKVESQAQKAISGKKGELLRIPSRFLTAEDEFFKSVARRSALSGLAVRKAAQEGLTGDAAKKRAGELLADPTDEMWEDAMDYARYVTFQRPLGPVGSSVSRATQEMPILKAVVPFVRTPLNIFKSATEHSPAAPLLKEWRRDFAAGGAKRDIAIAKAVAGTSLGALMAEAAAKGLITGSPPRDKNKRALMYADGWQPYSVKIGDKFYSYQRLDPFALTIGTSADMATLGEGMTEKQREKGAALVWASIMGNLSNKTWLSGVSDMLAALEDPERFGTNFIDRFAGSATVPTGVAQIARTMDPTMRETDGTLDYIQSRIPEASKSLMPKRDVWGRPIEKEGGVGPDIISPIWTSTAKADPATWEAIRLGAPIKPPADDESLTPAQMDRWRQLSGETAHRWVTARIETPEYREADDEDRASMIARTMKLARSYSKAAALNKQTTPTDEPEKDIPRKKKVADKSRAPALTLDDIGDFDIISVP